LKGNIITTFGHVFKNQFSTSIVNNMTPQKNKKWQGNTATKHVTLAQQ